MFWVFSLKKKKKKKKKKKEARALQSTQAFKSSYTCSRYALIFSAPKPQYSELLLAYISALLHTEVPLTSKGAVYAQQ